jgi:hypothetical protein
MERGKEGVAIVLQHAIVLDVEILSMPGTKKEESAPVLCVPGKHNGQPKPSGIRARQSRPQRKEDKTKQAKRRTRDAALPFLSVSSVSGNPKSSSL